MARRRTRELFSRVTLAIALGVALGCGGPSESTSGDSRSDAGNGGTTTEGTGGSVATGGVATGGDATGGASGSGGQRPCTVGDAVFQSGDSFPAPDGCNTCFCDDGEVGCTLLLVCPADCADLSALYQEWLVAAKDCGPRSQCDVVMPSGLQCGCLTHVGNPPAINELVVLTTDWINLGCGGGVTCGMCPPDPTGGYCSSDGVCVDTFPE
jgi:hypothetical protein